MKVGERVKTHPQIPQDVGPEALRAETVAEAADDGGVEGVVAEEGPDDTMCFSEDMLAISWNGGRKME